MTPSFWSMHRRSAIEEALGFTGIGFGVMSRESSFTDFEQAEFFLLFMRERSISRGRICPTASSPVCLSIPIPSFQVFPSYEKIPHAGEQVMAAKCLCPPQRNLYPCAPMCVHQFHERITLCHIPDWVHRGFVDCDEILPLRSLSKVLPSIMRRRRRLWLCLRLNSRN